MKTEIIGPEIYSSSAPNENLKPRHPQIAFADPSAWYISAAVAPLLQQVEIASLNNVGSILIAPDGPHQTIAEVIKLAAAGKMSPMRFPAATPSSLLAPAMIVSGLRGPSLTFPCPAAAAIPIITSIAERWFNDFSLEAIVVAALTETGESQIARAVLLKKGGQESDKTQLSELLSGFLTGKSEA